MLVAFAVLFLLLSALVFFSVNVLFFILVGRVLWDWWWRPIDESAFRIFLLFLRWTFRFIRDRLIPWSIRLFGFLIFRPCVRSFFLVRRVWQELREDHREFFGLLSRFFFSVLSFFRKSAVFLFRLFWRLCCVPFLRLFFYSLLFVRVFYWRSYVRVGFYFRFLNSNARHWIAYRRYRLALAHYHLELAFVDVLNRYVGLLYVTRVILLSLFAATKVVLKETPSWQKRFKLIVHVSTILFNRSRDFLYFGFLRWKYRSLRLGHWLLGLFSGTIWSGFRNLFLLVRLTFRTSLSAWVVVASSFLHDLPQLPSFFLDSFPYRLLGATLLSFLGAVSRALEALFSAKASTAFGRLLGLLRAFMVEGNPLVPFVLRIVVVLDFHFMPFLPYFLFAALVPLYGAIIVLLLGHLGLLSSTGIAFLVFYKAVVFLLLPLLSFLGHKLFPLHLAIVGVAGSEGVYRLFYFLLLFSAFLTGGWLLWLYNLEWLSFFFQDDFFFSVFALEVAIPLSVRCCSFASFALLCFFFFAYMVYFCLWCGIWLFRRCCRRP